MKRVFWIAFILCCLPFTGFALSAQSAVLIDGFQGNVLQEHRAYEKMGMASTTKIMTALVALERGRMDDIVTVSYQAAVTEGSSMYLKPQERIPLGDLLYGLMLSSGNDAATAIAEYIGGSVEGFSVLMNEKAAELGLKDTHFTNPHGLADDDHYTTAYDLAQLARHALQNESFADIVSTKSTKAGSHYLSNHNKMLSLYDGANGVKTGFTKKTGRTLVSSAERNGLRLIAVTLNAPDDWNDHISMLDYGFANYEAVTPVVSGDYIRTIPCIDGTDVCRVMTEEGVTVCVPKGEGEQLTAHYELPDTVTAPVAFGQTVGKLSVKKGEETIWEVPLRSSNAIAVVEKKSIWKTFRYLWLDLLWNFRR